MPWHVPQRAPQHLSAFTSGLPLASICLVICLGELGHRGGRLRHIRQVRDAADGASCQGCRGFCCSLLAQAVDDRVQAVDLRMSWHGWAITGTHERSFSSAAISGLSKET